MLTIFTVPKPFRAHIGIIQRNAIESWTLLEPKPEIILFGNEKGTAEIAREFRIRYISDRICNESGIPLIGDIFQRAREVAENNILAYVNADIILMSDFMRAVERIKDKKKFLMVGQRWDFDIREELNFENPNWETELREKVLKSGKLHSKTGIDYFVFNKGLYKKIPPFVIRTIWDEWLLYEAWRQGIKIIDATHMIMSIHQNHRYLNAYDELFDPWESKEAKRNLKLAGGYRHCFTIKDATHVLTPEGLKPVPKMSLIRRLEILPYVGFFVRQGKKLLKFI